VVSYPFRLRNPVDKERKYMNTKEISLTAVFAALYAMIVIIFAPISYGPIQLRVADALIPLSAYLGIPVIYGVTLGAIIANTYWFISPIDVIFGSLANLLASFIIYKYKERIIPASLTASFIIGLMVGGYLWLFFPAPDILGITLPPVLAMITSITLSSIIAITVLGLGLLNLIKGSNYFKSSKA
jgi:uncharacterized membrane protein